MARNTSTETREKMSADLTTMGLEPRVEVGTVVWSTYTDDVRVLDVCGVPVKFVSADKGVTWKGAFPMLGCKNADGTPVETKGYYTKDAGPFDTRFDHLAIAFGRQLATVADLRVAKTTTRDERGVAALREENVKLNARAVSASVMEILYEGESADGQTEITADMWAVLSQKLQEKIASSFANLIPDGVTFADGSPLPEAPKTTRRK